MKEFFEENVFEKKKSVNDKSQNIYNWRNVELESL